MCSLQDVLDDQRAGKDQKEQKAQKEQKEQTERSWRWLEAAGDDEKQQQQQQRDDSSSVCYDNNSSSNNRGSSLEIMPCPHNINISSSSSSSSSSSNTDINRNTAKNEAPAWPMRSAGLLETAPQRLAAVLQVAKGMEYIHSLLVHN